MNKTLLIIGLALAVSASTAMAQQRPGNGEPRRQRAQAGQCGENNRPAREDSQVRQGGQRRGGGPGLGQGQRARQSLRDGTGPRCREGVCVDQTPRPVR